jgi:uncharacterized membrane protein YeaQ/YmgE (transglycosylase-associated protein family)
MERNVDALRSETWLFVFDGTRLTGTKSVQGKGARDHMGILAWIIFGFIVGLIARWIVPGGAGGGILADIVVGIIGALLGGWIYGLFNHVGVTGFNIPSMICAIVGAVVLLFILRAVRGGRPAV